MNMTEQDRQRISDAVRIVEEKSSGEIVCVLARSSSDATALPVFVAAVVALALPWLLVASTAMTVQRILILQVAFFAILVLVLCLPKVRGAIMPRRARRVVAHRQAAEQFVIRGITRKKDRCGILIFVSLAERYARIMVDEGIAARVTQSQWQKAVDALTTHMRDDRIADGFVAAIDLCGNELAAHFPRTEAKRDELPDRIYLI